MPDILLQMNMILEERHYLIQGTFKSLLQELI
jgi:hypothetical protein